MRGPLGRAFKNLYVPHKSYDLAEDCHVVKDKVAHFVVFWVEDEFAVALVETLDRRAVLDERNNYLAVFCNGLFLYDYFIAVEHSYFYHGIALYGEHEKIVAFEEIGGNGVKVLIIFLGENGFACGDGTDERHFDRLLVYRNCAAFILSDLAFAYESLF